MLITFAKKTCERREGSEAAGVLFGPPDVPFARETVSDLGDGCDPRLCRGGKETVFLPKCGPTFYTDMKENFFGRGCRRLVLYRRKSGKRKGTGRTAGAAPEKFFPMGTSF